MSQTITCPQCKEPFQLDEALLHDAAKKMEKEFQVKYQQEMLAYKKQTEDELQERLQKETVAIQEKVTAKKEEEYQRELQNRIAEARDEKHQNVELRKQLAEIMQQLRSAKSAQENVEIEMQKKLLTEEQKIREQVMVQADEKYRLDLAMREKTIQDLQKSLSEAQRKATQGSQQLQGEVLELGLEELLREECIYDDISPIDKGVKGADIQQMVRTPSGRICGVILWEIKNTKAWSATWIQKLKSDVLSAKANIGIIVSEVLPKERAKSVEMIDGIYVCKPAMVGVLAQLLRQGLMDVARAKNIGEDKETKANALYAYVTSHEFMQQIEMMVQQYTLMRAQIQKERVAFEKFWAMREKQAGQLLLGTAKIYGDMQGYLGEASMPKVQGMELLEEGEYN